MSKRLLSDMRAERGEIIDQMTALTESREFDPKKFADLEGQIATLDAQIGAAERAQALQASLARPVAGEAGNAAAEINPEQRTLSQIRAMDLRPGQLRSPDDYLSLARRGLEFTPSRDTHFRSIGEQLQAVFAHYSSRGSNHDPRLVRAPTGASEVDPTGGGFLVQVDFATSIFMLAHDMGNILRRVNRIPISGNSNGLKLLGIDETSRATGSRWGGVQSYWTAEGTSVTASKPKFRMVEFDLKKLFSVMYMTDELLQDTTALTTVASQAFSEEIMFMTEDAVFEGTGAGQPLGVLNAGATVSVAKETGQAAASVVKENVDKMYSRVWVRSLPNAVWYINQDVQPALDGLVQVVGTGGAPVYLPPGGLSGKPFGTLKGLPVEWTEYNATLGTVGDIVLADMSQYMLVDKNGAQAATSMHVAFLTDEMVFRITYRVDGKPIWNSAVTPFKGSSTKSPFITLATRA